MSKLKAMVLAAGYGTRLAPVTDYLPKPLLPVAGEPLLDQIIERVFAAGITEIGVNSHHLGAMVGSHLATHRQSSRLVHFPEAEILDTGGALDNARTFLAESDHFLVHNGDVTSNLDLSALVHDHQESGALVTLALVSWPAVNTVWLGSEGSVRYIAGLSDAPDPAAGDRKLTYTGISVFKAEFLDRIAAGASSLITPIVTAIEQDPGSVRGYAPQSLQWDDLGTLARWLRATEVDADTSDGFHLSRITGHGSDRKFWRLGQGDWSAVAMMSPPEDEEYKRFVSIGTFLNENYLGAAKLLSRADEARTLLMTDLGSDSLHSFATDPSCEAEALGQTYGLVIDHLLKLQAATALAQEVCPSAVDRVFDREQLLWETSYFKEQFLHGHLGLDEAETEPLADEFATLARAVDEMPKVMMHRDFQSQNILLQNDQVRLVDFQGMRLGPLTYDLASVIWDPYVELPNELREALVSRFAAHCQDIAPAQIAQLTVLAGLQRIMQALGAYAFLGHVKSHDAFLRHIPAAWRNLQALLSQTTEIQLPKLTQLITEKS